MAKYKQATNRPVSPAQSSAVGGHPPEISSVLSKVRTLLQEKSPEKALDVLTGCRLKSPWISNAIGVCQLHLGNAQQALKVFQGLAMASGIQLKLEAPTEFKINYAMALLAVDNLGGCLTVLHEIKEEENPTVQQLRATLLQWKQSLSVWKKLQWALGAYPRWPTALDLPLGELG